MEFAGQIFNALEILGTISFAISGAMVAIRKRVDLFGVLFLGVTTALGGGMMRDMILGRFPPAMFRNNMYVTLAAVTSIAVFLIAAMWKNKYLSSEEGIDQINNVFDALGLGAFTVTGAQVAVEAGYADNFLLTIVMGMMTGIGGGLVRDLMVREIPFVLRKRVYAVASIAGGLVFCVLSYLKMPENPTVFISVMITFGTRMLATRFKWNLPKAIE